jgi:hypothetical protein
VYKNFASQSLHNRKILKKKSGDVNDEANFSLFILLHKRAKPILPPGRVSVRMCVCVWVCACGRRIWGACRIESRPQRRFSLSLSHIRQRASTRVCDTYRIRRHTGTRDTLSQIHRFPVFHYGRLRCTTGVWRLQVSGVAFSAYGTYLLRPLNRSIISLGGWVSDLGVYDNAKGTFKECPRLRRHRMDMTLSLSRSLSLSLAPSLSGARALSLSGTCSLARSRERERQTHTCVTVVRIDQ